MPGGVAIRREITLRELPGEFHKLGIDPATVDFRPALLDVSVYLYAEYRRAFAESRSPDGTPFAPLKQPRRRRRDRAARGGSGQKPLVDRGILAASGSSAAARGGFRQLATLSLEQGTADERAAFHQDGTRYITPRPFVGIAERQARMIELIVLDRITRQYFGAA